MAPPPHPAARTDDPVAAAAAVVAVHATDPGSVHLAALAPCTPPDIIATERALYDERSLVRMLGMRRTVFVVPSDLAPIVQAACTCDIAARERRRLIGVLGDNHVHDPARWLGRVEAATLAALDARGEALAVELSDDVPDLRRTVTVTSGRQVVEIPLSTRVLFVLAAQGRIVRGRPRGTWLSSQYRWAPTRAWLGRDLDEIDADDARAALATRWLAAFGPATPADLQWWAGWTKTQTRAALARLDVTEVDMDGAIGVVLADDLDATDLPPPWAALLPALDATPMGWRDRAWYLGDHADALFDRSGNIGPTVWWEGRVVGGWVQRDDGVIVHRLLQDVDADARAAIDAEVARLQPCLGDVTVVPRFHTPLERELPRVTSVHDHLMALHTQMRSAMATQRLDLPFAVCVITDDLPAVYDCNVVVVTNHVPPGVLLRSVDKVAAMAGWRHRRVEVDEPAVADRLRAALLDAGYTEERFVTMRLAAAPPAPSAAAPGTAVVDVAAHRDLARRITAQQPWADSDAIVDQMLERERRLARVADVRVIVAPPDAPVSRCLLLRHGTLAEVDAVSTLTDARGQGWSNAVMVRAIAEAGAAGADEVVLVADAGDWPKRWYERLGFHVVGHSSAFVRAPGAPERRPVHGR